MRRFASHAALPVRLAIAAAAVVALLAAGALLAFAVVNARLVPRVVERVSRGAGAAIGAAVEVGEARLTLGGDLVLDAVEVSVPRADANLRVRTVRVEAGWRRLARLWRAPAWNRSGRPRSARASGADAGFRLVDGRDLPVPWALLRRAAGDRLLPPRIAAVGVQASVRRAQAGDGAGRAVRIGLPTAEIRHEASAGTLVLAADGTLAVAGTPAADGTLAADGTPAAAKTPAAAGGRASGEAATPRRGSGAPFSVEATLSYASESVRAAVDVRSVTLAWSGTLTGEADAKLSVETLPDGDYAAEGTFAVHDVRAMMPAVAPDEIGPVAASYQFEARVEPGYRVGPEHELLLPFEPPEGWTGRVVVDRGELRLNGITMELMPELQGLVPPRGAEAGFLSVPAGRRWLELGLRLPRTPVDRIREAVPEALLGPLQTLRLAGAFEWELDLRVPLHAIGEMTWESRRELAGFAVRQIGLDVNPFKLKGPFLHTVPDERPGGERSLLIPAARTPSTAWALEHSEHSARRIAAWRAKAAEAAEHASANRPRIVPPVEHGGATRGRAGAGDPFGIGAAPAEDRTYRYVRLEEMSPWVVRAILTAEDGDFFFHDGVNFYTLPRALERNVRAGEIQFGASTITMQLAKMLFLDYDRHVARKLQEAFLVYLMEQHVGLTKERILEIYINIAEFGPGVYGIADAADYYFGRDPAELTAGEATWLASILPSPRRYHEYYEAGQITWGWFERMKSYFSIMLERERMTHEEYAEAVQAPPQFAK